MAPRSAISGTGDLDRWIVTIEIGETVLRVYANHQANGLIYPVWCSGADLGRAGLGIICGHREVFREQRGRVRD